MGNGPFPLLVLFDFSFFHNVIPEINACHGSLVHF